MTPAEATRPVLIVLALCLAGCGAVDGDPHRFRALGDQVAAIDIPLDAPRRPEVEGRSGDNGAKDSGLRPARFSPVHVAVMSPHEMWDARDAQTQGLRSALAPMRTSEPAPAVKAVIAPQAMPEAAPVLRPAVVRDEDRARGRTVQLGAFSSEAAAREAWVRLKARADLAALSPVFETVSIDGRVLTRLKVGPIPAEAAADLCRAAQVADPWCRRAG